MCHYIFSFIWHQVWTRLNIPEKFARVNEKSSLQGKRTNTLKSISQTKRKLRENILWQTKCKIYLRLLFQLKFFDFFEFYHLFYHFLMVYFCCYVVALFL